MEVRRKWRYRTKNQELYFRCVYSTDLIPVASQYIHRWPDNCRQHMTMSNRGLLLSLNYCHTNFNNEMSLILRAKKLWTQINFTFMDLLLWRPDSKICTRKQVFTGRYSKIISNGIFVPINGIMVLENIGLNEGILLKKPVRNAAWACSVHFVVPDMGQWQALANVEISVKVVQL